MSDAPIAIELFSCSGGMAEGFRRAGIVFDLVIDADIDACASYEANLGHSPVRMDVHDLVRMARFGFRPQCWLLVADPPCTPWSSGGKRRGLDDPRDCLRPTIDLIKLIRPEAYLIGNVPGLQHGPNASVLEETIGSLGAFGYCTADFVSLDAADFGVPQHRVRPFWFGHRRGTHCLTWPSRTHGRPMQEGHLPGMELAPWVTAGSALADLPKGVLGVQCRVAEHTENHPDDLKLDAPARTQTGNPHGCAVLRLDSKPKRRDVKAWLDERPSTTVTQATWVAQPGQCGSEKKPYQGANAIVLSELARARLQGFPDGWTFCGKTKKSRNAQIGMAMPPPVAQAVADAIMQWRAECSSPNAEGS